jgi:uncharacterized membrane protein/DNA-binding MarR family transcriptional regulator
MAVLLLAIAAACALLLAWPASAQDGDRANDSAHADMSLASSSMDHCVALGETAWFSVRVAGTGLQDGENLYLAMDGLPANWTRSVSDSVPTSRGFQIPAGESFHDIALDVGDRAPAGNYTFELRVDRGLDLSTLARLVLEVELTPYAFTVTMPDLTQAGVMPSADVEATFSIAHDAPQREIAVISATSVPKGWQVFVGRPMVTVEPASVGRSQVLVRVPDGAQAGDYSIDFGIDSVDPRFVPTSFLAKVNVVNDPRLGLVSTGQSTGPYGSAVLSVDIANSGNSWLTLESVGLGGIQIAPTGWSLACDDVPVQLGPGEDSVLRLLVTMPSGAVKPLAGRFDLPITVRTGLTGYALAFIAPFRVPEVRTLAIAAVTPTGQDALGDVLVNPYVDANGTGYVEVKDLGNLGRYRDVTLDTVYTAPFVSVVFTRSTVSLWSARSWVVGVDVVVSKDAAPGHYNVTVVARDADTGLTTRDVLDVRVYHLSARLEGQLWVLDSTGTDIGGQVPLGSTVTLTGTIVNDGDFVVPRTQVALFDTLDSGYSAQVASFTVSDIPAKGSRNFTVDFVADTRGDHLLEAYLDVPGGVPAEQSSAGLPAPIRAEPVKAGLGAMLLPLVIGSVLGLGVGALAILGTEAARFALMAMLLLPLYTRLRPRQVTDQFVRGQILGYVKANPGETYTSIRRALDLGNGQFVYHARVLETQGLIRSVKDGANRRFYPADMRVPTEIRDLRLNHVQRIIYSIVMEYPGISQRKIAKLVNLSPSTVSYHVNIMTKVGVIERHRSGRLMICFANGKA